MSFARSLFTVSGFTIISRIAGFIRDTLTATFLGAGPEADAFFVAQRLPNLFRSLFAEGAFSAAFVPLYTTLKERRGDQDAQEFAGSALALLLAALVPFSVLIMMAMPSVMLVLAPGFNRDHLKYNLAVEFSTITFPYLALISVTALQTGVLNARGVFGPGAIAPIAFNIVLIVVLFATRLFQWPVGYALAWAVTFSGLVQCLWLAISCYRHGVAIPWRRPKLNEETRRLFRRLGPGVLGAGAAQINLLISTILASLLPTGSVSYLFYADRLNQLPLGIVGIAVATTLLPLLSRHVEAGQEKEVQHYTSRAIEFCILLGLPATLGLGLAATPIIQTLFEHGVFSHKDTLETASALGAYALGIPGFLLVKVFAASFFARHDTATPVKIAFVAMTVNVVASLLFIGPFQHIGIALANSLAVTVNAILLFLRLRRKKMPLLDQKFRDRFPRLLLSASGMGAATWYFTLLVTPAMRSTNTLGQLLGLSTIIGLSCLIYGALLQLSGAVRLKDILMTLQRKPPSA